jgi:hypothetical protein
MIQSDFTGGLNIFNDSAKLADNEYGKALNIRNRENALQTIKEPLLDSSAPSGKKQGIYGFDKYIILFSKGKGYYKDITIDSPWTQIGGLLMDPTCDYIYVAAVPASTLNYNRKLIVQTQVSGNANNPAIALESGLQINGTPGGLVVQDGINQPWVIFPDGTARVIQNYAQWNKATNLREYVPIGKQMAFVNGILFVMGQDGKTIYRSVSGRPLDFVVNVDVNGNKGGDATTTSYAASFNEATYIGGLATGELLVSTNKISYAIEFDYNNTIFDEPRFLNRKPYDSGIVNQFSFVGFLRDDGSPQYYFIDLDGIRTFTTGNQNEGRNSAFARNVNKGLVKRQTVTAATIFDNYSIFSVKTTYNDDRNFIAVFDNLTLTWICFDDYSVGTIKQFAVADQTDNPVLYAITEDNVYKVFGGENNLLADVYFKSNTSGSCSTQIKLDNIYCCFTDGTIAGTVSATDICNGIENKTLYQTLSGIPVENQKFNFQGLSKQSFKVQPRIRWQNDSKLLLLETSLTAQTQSTPIQQTAKSYA